MGKNTPESNHKCGKKYRRKIKMEVLGHYCGSDKPHCQCPGCDVKILEFLALDHKNGGGTAQRKTLKKIGWQFYLWLKQNNYPSGFQVLCHNCNAGKQLNGGQCPHLAPVAQEQSSRFLTGRSVGETLPQALHFRINV